MTKVGLILILTIGILQVGYLLWWPEFLGSYVVRFGLLASVLLVPVLAGYVPVEWLGLKVQSFGSRELLIALAGGFGVSVFSEAADLLLASIGVEHKFVGNTIGRIEIPDWAVFHGITLPVVAFYEELLFRGVLIGVGGRAFGDALWMPVLLSSAVFGKAHGNGARVFVTGICGGLYALLFVFSGSLLVPIISHLTSNIFLDVVHNRLGITPFSERV